MCLYIKVTIHIRCIPINVNVLEIVLFVSTFSKIFLSSEKFLKQNFPVTSHDVHVIISVAVCGENSEVYYYY